MLRCDLLNFELGLKFITHLENSSVELLFFLLLFLFLLLLILLFSFLLMFFVCTYSTVLLQELFNKDGYIHLLRGLLCAVVVVVVVVVVA